MDIAIYALVDPRTSQVRYIGKSQSVDVRVHRHLSDAARGVDTHCARWLRSLLSKGLRPEVFVICWCKSEDWQACEQKWIDHYREAGAPLTNLAAGGRGFSDPSGNISAKISKTLKDRGICPPNNTGKKYSPEARARMSAAKKGKPMSPALQAALAKGRLPRKVDA